MNRLLLTMTMVFAFGVMEQPEVCAITEHGLSQSQRPNYKIQFSINNKPSKSQRPKLNEYAIAYDLDIEPGEKKSEAQKAFEEKESEFKKEKPLAGALKKVVLKGAKMYWHPCWEKVTDKDTGKSMYRQLTGVLAYTTKEQYKSRLFPKDNDKAPVSRLHLITNQKMVGDFDKLSKAERSKYHEKQFQEYKNDAKKDARGDTLTNDKGGNVRFEGTFELRGGFVGSDTKTITEIRGGAPENAIIRIEQNVKSFNETSKKETKTVIYCK